VTFTADFDKSDRWNFRSAWRNAGYPDFSAPYRLAIGLGRVRSI
jgi:hypothetical protein